ncbi:DUF262 domain-containing protein [Subtercola boreus]|uniref:DUF262 domain-containing protein n=1 Tax=Subtercola boreus TaxID=120213 RepID=A0A3E0W7S9_9MICO|nr:DUF262 domain-containing protein [Subtercola boreus]RFA19077.1 hypothetical protein B7R24_13175 [Subtercola boreus]RFA19215.1 hypothetical protein B7R23_13155 [Subtercola boreus]RFA25677.1 hypothetical protein B7R25_13275 [Subtercola boreus]
MVSATNVDATAVNTIQWLARPSSTIVVPVYQRQYRWDIGGCEQLLGDIRAAADSDDRQRHFIGSILSTTSFGDDSGDDSDDDSGELVLIDGQQRITTLMLLIAALHHTVLQDDAHASLATELAQVLVRSADPNRTKLRPHRAWADVFESVVLNRRGPGDEARDSRFDDNYAFFRSQVLPNEVARVWRGLQKLEHVAITLGADANAQQIFESLNSTGEPLRDHELIHNYVLMGLSHAEQSEIEDTFWVPIEQNTGESIASFWRHYLVMTTGREVAVAGERGVYDAFRQRFPRLDLDTLRAQATEWREFSGVFRMLLEPAREADAEIGRQLGYLNTFGRGMYPLAMRAYHEYSQKLLGREALIDTLEQIQSLVLRRTVVGVGVDRLVARLCRAREEGTDALRRAIARITPSDERVRVALKFSDLPHPGYVLGRIAGVETPVDLAGLDVENVFPLAPSDTWSGGGDTPWSEYSDDQQNSHRALAQTLGNLALLEQPLAERAVGLSFPAKRALYASSAVPTTTALSGVSEWGTAAIARRTVELTDVFLRVWRRASGTAIDDDGLTPILDAQRRRGWPRGWEREFEYVEYRGEHWEVYDVKYLFNRIFKRLWADARPSVVAFSAQRGGPLYDSQAWNGHWDTLDESHYLYMGWDSKYMLTAVQGVLDEAGLSAEVFVKYSYIGALM